MKTVLARKGEVKLVPAGRTLLIEAAELGLALDEWPESVEVEFGPGRRHAFGPGQPAEIFGTAVEDIWRYPSADGRCWVLLFNENDPKKGGCGG